LNVDLSEVVATAEQLDEASDWSMWTAALDMKMQFITGPAAAHFFKFCRRADLGAVLCAAEVHNCEGELQVAITEFEDGTRPDPEDVMLVVKHWMADPKPSQIIAVAPASARALVTAIGPSEAARVKLGGC
jgi:hypothetical protein